MCINATGVGNATINVKTLNDISLDFEVVVTDLITKPTLNSDKFLLDIILSSRVKETQYGTRAGIVASAGFLLLEMHS